MPKLATITAKQILALVEQQDYRCAVSGQELSPETASLDHIVPVSRGGTHTLKNLWVVHHQINSAKGTMLADEFVLMCRNVLRHQDFLAATRIPDLAGKESDIRGNCVP